MASAKTPLATIVHPTDFTASSTLAFAHALNIALATKSQLCLLHVRSESEPPPGKSEFKHVREVLVRWNRLDGQADAIAIENELGLRLSSVSVPAKNPRTGILDFLDDHPCDLVVLATHEHKGLSQWFDIPVEQTVLRKARVMSLFLRDGARRFVDPNTGALALRTVLVPIDDSLDCIAALRRIKATVRHFASGASVQLLHVGERAPNLLDEDGKSLNLPIIIRKGPVVDTILEVAENVHAELIAMPTAGRHGLLDALRGSTTARILDDARWPLLAIPVGLTVERQAAAEARAPEPESA
jgi:nucleotide-binding universal stress UspA family protein